ncbi:MAG: RDD family protein [Rubrivivax sp.]|nr:RDD family protein [Rubrivivax sp.]
MTAPQDPPSAAPAQPDAWPPDPATQATPGVWRRLACFLYEGVLLFGVVMIAGLLYSVTTQQRHALQGSTGLQAFLFVLLGAYFTWFWTHGGQTLAMQTWHVRLVTREGRPLGWGRAAARYLLSWLWFLPALLALHFSGLGGGGTSFGFVFAGVLAYAALARLHPDRQYWHDAVCGTRLVTWRPPPRRKKPRP